MYIKLFDVVGNKVVPTEHCYVITWLKEIMDKYPEHYLKIFAYFQYMCSWNPDTNPYLAMKEEDREETILRDVGIDFSVDDDLIQESLQKCKEMCELPAYRAWKSAKIGLQNISNFVENQKITTGKDGSGPFIMSSIEKLPSLNKAFNEAYRAYMDAAKIVIRGDKFNSQV